MKIVTKMLSAALLSLLVQSTANASIIFDLTAASSGSSVSYSAGGITAVFSNATLNGAMSSFVIDGDGIPVIDGPTGFGAGLDRFEVVFDQTVRLLSYFVGFVASPNVTAEFSAGGFSSFETGFVDEAVSQFSNQFIVNAGETLVVAATSPLVTNELIQFRELTVEQATAPVPTPATLALFGLGLAGLGWSRRKKA